MVELPVLQRSDRLVRIFYFKSEEEPFDIKDGTLEVSTSCIPRINLEGARLVRYGGEGFPLEDLRKLNFNQVKAQLQKFHLGSFCCMDFLVSPTSLYFDLPDMNVRIQSKIA